MWEVEDARFGLKLKVAFRVWNDVAVPPLWLGSITRCTRS